MRERMNYHTAAPEILKVMLALHETIQESGLDRTLLNLVYLRASQINGCAYCIDMHSKDLRADGENEQRVYMLDAWREVSVYSDRERAALAWTEAITRIFEAHVPDEIYEEARAQFSERELAMLTLAIVAINGWNRLNIAFRTPAGSYQPAHATATAGRD